MALNSGNSVLTHNPTLAVNTPVQIDGSQSTSNVLLNTTRKLYVCMVGGVAINETFYVKSFPEGTVPSAAQMTTTPYSAFGSYNMQVINIPNQKDRVANTTIWFMGPNGRELSILEVGGYRP